MKNKFILTIFLTALLTHFAEAQSLLESKLGVVSKEVDSLNIKITSESRCSFGDLDAIFFDLYHSNSQKLLLSIEELNGISNYNASIDLVKTEFDKTILSDTGFNAAIKINKPTTPRLFGLFICKDSKNENKCLGKPAIGINEIIATYNANNTLPQDYNAEDKIYFFSLFILEKNKLSLLKSALDTSEYPMFKEYLTSRLGEKQQLDPLIKKIESYNTIIGSEAINFEKDNAIKIILPKVDPNKCIKK